MTTSIIPIEIRSKITSVQRDNLCRFFDDLTTRGQIELEYILLDIFTNDVKGLTIIEFLKSIEEEIGEIETSCSDCEDVRDEALKIISNKIADLIKEKRTSPRVDIAGNTSRGGLHSSRRGTL